MRTFRFSINYLMWLFALLLVDHYLVEAGAAALELVARKFAPAAVWRAHRIDYLQHRRLHQAIARATAWLLLVVPDREQRVAEHLGLERVHRTVRIKPTATQLTRRFRPVEREPFEILRAW